MLGTEDSVHTTDSVPVPVVVMIFCQKEHTERIKNPEYTAHLSSSIVLIWESHSTNQ